MQAMKEDMKDRDLQIEEYAAKMACLTDENKIMREGTEVMQRKIDHIYEHHILIPKEGGGQSQRDDIHCESEHREQAAFMKNIQEEVRKLHF